MSSSHSVPLPGEDHDQPESLSQLVTTEPCNNDGPSYHGRFHWQAPPSPDSVLSDHGTLNSTSDTHQSINSLHEESAIKYLLRDHFARQEDADAKNKAEISEKLQFVTNSLSTMDQALKTVTLTLGRMENTLERSLLLQEQSLAGQTALLASIEKTQNAILSFLSKYAIFF